MAINIVPACKSNAQLFNTSMKLVFLCGSLAEHKLLIFPFHRNRLLEREGEELKYSSSEDLEILPASSASILVLLIR